MRHQKEVGKSKFKLIFLYCPGLGLKGLPEGAEIVNAKAMTTRIGMWLARLGKLRQGHAISSSCKNLTEELHVNLF